MRRIVIALCFGLAACVSAPGAADLPSAAATAAAADGFPISVDLPAGTYRLDPRHANVQFRIRHMNIGYLGARFDTREATLEFDPEDPSRSRLAASIDPMSVNTGVLGRDGERTFDQNMGRGLGRTPITFVSTGIVRTGQFTARATGDLTMNGQTHPATFDITYHGGRSDPIRGGAVALGFSARAVIDRVEWGVTQWQAFSADEVEILIDAEFVRQ